MIFRGEKRSVFLFILFLNNLKLHGNTIATIDALGVMSISNAGWASNTTKERLNGLPNVRVNQKNWSWFLNGNEWDGSWKRIGFVK